ncbi:odorant receptor 10-like isoform X2 [Leptinotarsa decemlineata]|uniref:odorant receptor 10-like isoform X2 n=1 Tax=Leptinotarsa decemlineata TaxID=7539 RepID=UPI003D30C34B
MRKDEMRQAKFAGCGYVVAICCMASAKSYYLAKNRRAFQILVDTLNDKIFQPKTSQQKCIAENSLRFYRTIKTVLLATCSMAVISSMTTPLLVKKNDENLPFASWYPFNVTSSPVHEVVYIHQCISCIYISYINIYADIMISGFTTFIGLQCDMLCDEMATMADCRKIEYSVGEFVEYHRHILRFAKKTEEVFSEIYFLQFIASTSCLCMTLFLLSVVERNTFEFFYLIEFLASMFNLLLVPCWFSSEMKRKSENIPLAIYSCPWMDASESVKKEIIYFMHRTQQPIRFKAIGFFNISVETFTSIVRSSFSYYAVLNNLNMKDD